MIVQFTETCWLNIKAWEVKRIDVDCILDDKFMPVAYFVCVTMDEGEEARSDYFRTYKEAADCAENFARALAEKLARD